MLFSCCARPRRAGEMLAGLWLSAFLLVPGCSKPVEYAPAGPGDADTSANAAEPPAAGPEAIAPPAADTPHETPLPLVDDLVEDSAEAPLADAPSEQLPPSGSPLPAELMGAAPEAGDESEREAPPENSNGETSTDDLLNDIFGPAGDETDEAAEQKAPKPAAESAFGDFLMGDAEEDAPAEEQPSSPEPEPEPEPTADPAPKAEPPDAPFVLPPLPAEEETQPDAAQPEEPPAAATDEVDLGWSPVRPETQPEPDAGEQAEHAPAETPLP
ncbi:MAG: hypothetical protein KDA37_00330 [Planctomycetales bacterium]|nr:hypothetical protein [Planctomycetales bacterium]